MSTQPQAPLPQIGKLVSVVPVGLKEAALDSPTFRATTLHFSDQIEFLERWLDGYAKSASRLTSELATLESTVGSFLSFSTNPLAVSEAVLDHDYTLLSMRRSGDGSRDLWNGLVSSTRKLEMLVAEPIRVFIQEDLRSFKESRRILEQTQKQYDYLYSRYSSHNKSKEPSAIREDAFQLHEARKAYLKASMDFSVRAPQVRNALDRLLVRVSFDQWREFKTMHNNNGANFGKWGQEMDRIKGWIHEMEGSEKLSRRELLSARDQIEETAETAFRPSRELEDYSISTIPYLGSRPLSGENMTAEAKPEKQGWVNLRTLTGKPTRTTWVKRWVFLKNGIFGCLVQGSRTGGVEESERIGVLLCNVRPAFQEERRFCFEVKTKNNSIMLQAETQKELMEWISSFEAAKRKALEHPASTDLSVSGKMTVQDPAFSISQPPAPEFSADPSESLTPNGDEPGSSDRGILSLPEREPSAFRASTEIGSRRSTGPDSENSPREHTSRLIQKLDLHRKSNNAAQSSSPLPSVGGGIASLITASHNAIPSMPIGVPDSDSARGRSLSNRSLSNRNAPYTTLAPFTLANPPAPTSMSKAAVIVSNERGIGLGQSDSTGGMPSGMMANLWGSSNWGFVNRFEHERLGQLNGTASDQPPPTPMSDSSKHTGADADTPTATKPKSGPGHRQTLSLDGSSPTVVKPVASFEHPSFYPLQLRIQDAQFRLFFPNVKREEPLVLVIRATWSPNDQQEFPGRAYVTSRNIYFYSNYFGLVLTTSIALDTIKEVTAASGRDCDFLFLHFVPPIGTDTPGRGTVKTFLEPLRLLQRRLNFLIQDSIAVEPLGLEDILKTLTKMESDGPARDPSSDSWEDMAGAEKAIDGSIDHKPRQEFRAPIFIEKDLGISPPKAGNGRDVAKVRLPTQPVNYVPQGNLALAAERTFNISAKALFHILFGDNSGVWQLLLHERQARDIKQGPWVSNESRHLRRQLTFQIETADLIGRTEGIEISDYQIIDVLNDHLCYVVTDKRTPWHLPFKRSFRLVSKVVITFVSKSKSKLAIYTKVEWLWRPYGLQGIINNQAIGDLEQDALDLVDLVNEQVRKLGAHGRTKKAISVFGHVGRQNQASQLPPNGSNMNVEPRKPRQQRSLVQLLFEMLTSFGETAISSVFMSIFAFLCWTWKTANANKVVLLLLLSSVFFNMLYSSQFAYEWRYEKNAGNFMARLGVHPDNVMTKAVYLRDIDELIANSTIGQSPDNVSDCFFTFHEQLMRDQATPLSLGATGPRDAVTKSATKRIQQTRERLATYRHNLLVALRVVNSIEREVIQSEWERWLRQEIRRCGQVEVLLGKDNGDDEAEVQMDTVFAELTDDVEQWYGRYCTSCQKEQDFIELSGRSYGSA